MADPEPVRVAPSRWLPEVAVAVLAAVVLTVVSADIPARADGRTLDDFGYALLAVAGLVMGVSRRWPRVAALVVTAILCVFIARDYPNSPVWLTGLAVLAVLSWRTDRRTAVFGAIIMLAALTVTATVSGHLPILVSAVYLGWAAAAVFLGEALRSRRSYLAGLAERARFVERSREDETARRVAEERLRIARDLHDSVAHAMATINVQASAAVHVLADNPEAAGAALRVIARASAEVLDELGSMLSVLRDGAERAERAPAPGPRRRGAVGRVGWPVGAGRRVTDVGIDAVDHARAGHGGLPCGSGVADERVAAQSGALRPALRRLRHARGAQRRDP